MACYNAYYRTQTDISSASAANFRAQTPLLADCRAAIDIIPAGTYLPSGSLEKPLGLHMPARHRRKFLLPAAFRAGTCIVLVETLVSSRHDFHGIPPPVDAASAMYRVVWPTARRLAGQLVEQCLGGSQTGGTHAYTPTHSTADSTRNGIAMSSIRWSAGALRAQNNLGPNGDFPFRYRIEVKGVPPGMPGDGWVVDLHQYRSRAQHTVYEAGGQTERHGTRGFWVLGKGEDENPDPGYWKYTGGQW